MTAKSTRPSEPKPPNPVGHTNNPGKGKGKGNGGGRRYGAYGGYKGVPVKRANKLVDAQINPLLRDFSHQVQSSKRLHHRTAGDLRYLYGETGDYLRHQAGQVGNSFENFNNNQEAARASLMNQMQQQYQQNSQSAGSELQRLGINGQYTDQAATDHANAANMANQQMGNVQSTADLMKLGAMSMARSLQGMNKGQRAASLGEAANTSQENIFDIRRERRDLMQQRPELLRQMLEQLAAQGWGQYVDTRNLNQQQQQINLQRQAQAFSQRQANQANAQQNAYNSTMSSLAQQQLANTYPNRKP